MVAIVLALMSGLAILANFGLIVRARKSQNRGSLIPLIGGLAGVVALGILPINGSMKWAWLPLILDFTWLIAALTLLGWLLRISPNGN